ncbi:SpoIIE family protein phosphatase [Streptacidiphilus rugosus]|uniref:SpoIIE family protein phosphatase n=1 Tax=Streptacidiphilus rugosus TaxID=405783 RepID=UPI00055F2AF1|nr:SpoIIE family protein phosphatase [Streptacidiphilus rugosus]
MEHDSRLAFVDALVGILVDDTPTIRAWTASADRLITPGPISLAVPEGTRFDAAYEEAFRPVQVGLRGADGVAVPLDALLLPLRRTASPGAAEPASPPEQLLLALPADTAGRLRQDVAFVRELFLQDRVGVALFDPELRLVRTNTHLLPYTGLPIDLAGHRLHDFLFPEDAEAVDAMLRSVVETGQPLVTSPQLVRTKIDPRGGIAMAISAFRLQNVDGTVIGVAGLFTDITGEYRARRRLALLHEVTAAMGGTLSVSGVAQELAHALVGPFAEAAVVDVASAALHGDEIRPDNTGRLSLSRIAAAGESAPATGELLRITAADGEAHPVPQEGETGGLRSMTVRLGARGRLLGQVTVHRSPALEPYEPEDHVLLQEIAGRAGLALDNAYRYTYEHRAAVSLQRSLLPSAARSVPAVTTATVYLPAHSGDVGGDWFDVIPLSSTRVALVVGDVTGHGLQASATMARIRTAVRTLADLDLEPDELLVHLDDLVSQLLAETAFTDSDTDGEDDAGQDASADDDRTEQGSFAGTCLYALHDPIARTCLIASAGHPPPAVLHPDGRAEFLPVIPGPPLGVGGLPFELLRADIEPGSMLALYTDGLIERGDGDIDSGMAELLRRLSQVPADEVRLGDTGQRIVTGLPPTRLNDDVTLLLARTKAVPEQDVVVWTVDANPRSVAGARAAATACLERWGLEALVFTTELLLSELVTNAIRYGRPPITVRMIRAGSLTCEVSDGSSSQPRMRRARVTDEGGRGLYLVAQLTSRWGSRYTARGKTIWAEQPLPTDSPAAGS